MSLSQQNMRIYLEELQKILHHLEEEVFGRIVSVLEKARRSGRRIFVMGNGGSAATAAHLACDLNKGTSLSSRRRFRVISLNENIPVMTAYANDRSYEDIFAEPLANLLEPGDVVIGISASGNSENVLKAIRYARQHKAVTIAFTGFKGGRLRSAAAISCIVPSSDMQKIEDIHLILTHILMQHFNKTGGKEARR